MTSQKDRTSLLKRGLYRHFVNWIPAEIPYYAEDACIPDDDY